MSQILVTWSHTFFLTYDKRFTKNFLAVGPEKVTRWKKKTRMAIAKLFARNANAIMVEAQSDSSLTAFIRRTWKYFLFTWNNFSQYVIWDRLKIFFFHRKVMFRSQEIEVLVFLTIAWFNKSVTSCHGEYQYMRQGAFLNISFEPQLIKSPNLVNW